MPSSDSLPETAGPQADGSFAPGVGVGVEAAVVPEVPAAAPSTADGPHHVTPALDPWIAGALKKDDAGLFAAVVQEHSSREVLMLGWMDEEALRRTLTSGRVTFWSRSREEYWRKGDTSGHRQWVRSVALDCDGDAVLVTVHQEGAACHTGTRTCFDGRELPAVTSSGPPQAPSPHTDSYAGGH